MTPEQIIRAAFVARATTTVMPVRPMGSSALRRVGRMRMLREAARRVYCAFLCQRDGVAE